jgi:hypothetical protein
MAWAVHAAARGLSREQIEHEILNSRDLSKKGSAAASVGLRHTDCEQGDCSVRALKRAFAMENPPMKAELKMNACIICGRKVQPTENWIRCVRHEVA